MVYGDRAVHAAPRQIGERIGIGGIHQPAMRPQRGQLIQLAIERDVRSAGVGWTRQGNAVAFWCWSMVVRWSIDDTAGSAAPAPIAPGWPAICAWLCPNMIAIGAGLAMWARAGVLTGASIDQAHAVQQMRCG